MIATHTVLLACTLMCLPCVTRAELVYDLPLDGVSVRVRPRYAPPSARGSMSTARSIESIAQLPEATEETGPFEKAVIDCVADRVRERLHEREEIRRQMNHEEIDNVQDQNTEEAGPSQEDEGVQVD